MVYKNVSDKVSNKSASCGRFNPDKIKEKKSIIIPKRVKCMKKIPENRVLKILHIIGKFPNFFNFA
jgi:hypothetical protein